MIAVAMFCAQTCKTLRNIPKNFMVRDLIIKTLNFFSGSKELVFKHFSTTAEAEDLIHATMRNRFFVERFHALKLRKVI